MAAQRARSIAWPIFALVIGAVVAATAILFTVTFSGPPPMLRPRPLSEVAAALTGMRWQPPAPLRWDGPGGFGPPSAGGQRFEQPLRISNAARPPEAGWRESADPRTARAIAALIARPPGEVRAFTEAMPRPDGGELFGRFTVALRTPRGWRVVRSAAMPGFTRWHANTLLAMLAAIAALSIPAWAISRAITRPLRDLADAAAQARAGAVRPDFPLGGAGEVRALTRAVSAMHDRLAGHAAQRTAMLGAIAHDLGTPLTRLAFWVEQLPDGARDRALADIAEMRAMIADTLRFAADDAQRRGDARVEVGSVIESLVDDLQAASTPVSAEPGPRAIVRGDARALRRLFGNLVTNAIRYGERADVTWTIEDGAVLVRVRDEGNGVDPAESERLFAPFVRGEPSRNRATGGTGLGLAIVRSIAERHGGSVTLGNRTDRAGAEARVMLPLDG